MALSSMMSAVPSTPLSPFPTKVSNITSQAELQLPQNDLKARIKMEQPKLNGQISRRDAVSLSAAALLCNLIASDAAEARRTKPETRRKIREKLDKLREKAGVIKEKTDSNTGNKEQDSPRVL